MSTDTESIEKLTDAMSYESHTLPEGWTWEGAIAGPNGYNGHAYVANVACDPQGSLWVFCLLGRFRINRDHFARKRISDYPLNGLPLNLDPIEG